MRALQDTEQRSSSLHSSPLKSAPHSPSASNGAVFIHDVPVPLSPLPASPPLAALQQAAELRVVKSSHVIDSSHAIDSRAIDSRAIDSHVIDSRAIDSHLIDSRAIDSRAIDSHAAPQALVKQRGGRGPGGASGASKHTTADAGLVHARKHTPPHSSGAAESHNY